MALPLSGISASSLCGICGALPEIYLTLGNPGSVSVAVDVLSRETSMAVEGKRG